MYRKEFYDKVKAAAENKAVKEKLEAVYGEIVPDEIVSILSLFSKPELFDENESRTLSVNEVMHAEEDLQVPFKTNYLVPIVDIGNNDYIVYNGEKRVWCIYNILDEILYDESKSFEELFLR